MSARAIRAWIICVVLAIPIALGWLYAIGVFLGMVGGETWKVGYYGKFNRVRSAIEQMPDIRIVDSWQHHDVTLEDFSFTVVTTSGQTATVKFMEESPEMKMSGREEIQTYVRGSLAHER